MFKVITLTGKKVFNRYFDTLDRAEERFHINTLKVKKGEFVCVILAYVPNKKTKRNEIIKLFF